VSDRDLPKRHLRVSRQPHLAPGFLGVGWSTHDERPLSSGQRCGRCGRVAGRDASHLPRGFFCLACLAMRPEDESLAARSGRATRRSGREDRVPAARLSREDRRVLGANVHGQVFLAAVDAERSGDARRAARYRFWLSLYGEGMITAGELQRRFEEPSP
jgi:hypothetical protein